MIKCDLVKGAKHECNKTSEIFLDVEVEEYLIKNCTLFPEEAKGLECERICG